MREFIKNKIRRQLIIERLMNVDIDVDSIYNKYFKKDIDEVLETGMITKDNFKSNYGNTSTLETPLAKKGDKLNRCAIEINRYSSNHYSPNGALISLTINKSAVNYVVDNYNGNLKEVINDFRLQGDDKTANSISAEFTESKIKGSIHHELAHWLDDTLHNNHIKGRAIKSKEGSDGMTKKGLPINADKMEIEGQIHNMVQLKKQHSDEWDNLTFDDIIRLSPTFNTIMKGLTGEVKTKWLRNLKTRMYREGLLGKNMYN